MVFAKAALILMSGVSAEFPPRTMDVDGMFNKNVFKNIQTAVQAPNGRRLQGPMSSECADACPGVQEFLTTYMSNMEAMAKGEMEWICPVMDTAFCMNSAPACADPNQAATSETDMYNLDCFCKCPWVGKIASGGVAESDYCDSSKADVSCLFKNDKCSYVTKMMKMEKDTYQRGLDLHCEKLNLDCAGKEKLVGEGKCAATQLASWMTDCELAASTNALAPKKETCCPLGEALIECFTSKCVEIGMKQKQMGTQNSLMSVAEKAASQKSLDKDLEIGKVCPGTGIPDDASALEESTSSNALAAVLHASTALAALVVMI